jgi:hypothetical protein
VFVEKQAASNRTNTAEILFIPFFAVAECMPVHSGSRDIFLTGAHPQKAFGMMWNL